MPHSRNPWNRRKSPFHWRSGDKLRQIQHLLAEKSKVSQAPDAKNTHSWWQWAMQQNITYLRLNPTLATWILEGPHMFSESKVKISFVNVIIIYDTYKTCVYIYIQQILDVRFHISDLYCWYYISTTMEYAVTWSENRITQTNFSSFLVRTHLPWK